MQKTKPTGRRVSFTNQDGYELAGYLDEPEGSPSAVALFAHCFTCSKDFRSIRSISKKLAEAGLCVLRFDFTGLGESEGDFSDTNFSSNASDLVAAADYLKETIDAPRLLIGHSLGGAAVLQAAAQIESAAAIVTIAAPASPAHIQHLLADERDQIEREGAATVVLANRPFTIKKQFLDDLERTRIDPAIAALGRPLLLFHSPLDRVVGIENAEHIFVRARHPKSFVSLGEANHLLTDERDATFVAGIIAAWSARFL